MEVIMQKFSEFICKHKIGVLILSCVLLILSIIGMNLTKINYDILVYLPKDIETIKGQNILSEDFEMGAFSIAVIENMPSKEVLKLENNIKDIEGVNEVLSLYDIVGTTIPIDVLPDEIANKVHSENSDLLMITFKDSTSADTTIEAIEKIRGLTDERTKLGGMSSMVLDTRNLSSSEIAIYILIAVTLCLLVLELSLDSYIVPILLLLNIGCAILLNLGSNIFLGEISYITKALVAVLQLGVTTDFSIFLYHAYTKNKTTFKNKEHAMTEAIKETFTSVTGSSLTTIVGFLVLCTMELTLGRDLGLVMAKGVFLGVICVLTLFPSLLLVFDNLVEKTRHRQLMPNFTPLHDFIIKYHKIIFAIFLILIIPAYLANSKVDVYYKMDTSLPETLESIAANKNLKEKFNLVSPEMILLDKNIKTDKVMELTEELETTDGIDFVLSTAKIKNLGIDTSFLNDNNMFETDKYQMLILNSTYEIASNELNDQVEILNDIVKKYDKNGMVVGEGPLMKDLIKTSDTDFKNVNYSSIICIFIVLFFILKSLSLPILLILAIEFAIFINMGISYFSGNTLPFVAPIVLGTIQLGATIDYAILITTTYIKNRKSGLDKYEAMRNTLKNSTNSIFVSAMCFFSATFGVGIYSKIDMVGSLCTLISRGAIISMIVVVTVLPSILLIFDKLIMHTTLDTRKELKNMKKNKTKLASISLLTILTLSILPQNIYAMSKEETVYSKLNYDGTVKSIEINEHLINDTKSATLEDYTELDNILNINSDNKFTRTENTLLWEAEKKDIFYKGTTTKKLPISVNITYALDGEEKDLDEIIGKSGKVSIRLNYTNTDKHIVNGFSLYTPFTVMVGTTLKENVSNISISNGKIMSNGTKNILLGVAMPGLYQSLGLENLKDYDTVTISFETDCFELPSIYSVITPKLISSDDLNSLNKLNKIYDDVDTLKAGINTIEDGSKALKNGSSTLKNTLGKSIAGLENNRNDSLDTNELETIKKQVSMIVDSTFTDEYISTIQTNTWKQVQENMNPNDPKVTEIVTSSVTSAIQNYLIDKNELTDYINCKNGQEKMQKGIPMTTEEQMSCAVIASDTTLPLIEKYSKNASIDTASKTSMYVAENVSKSVSKTLSKTVANEVALELTTTLVPTITNEVKSASISSLKTLYDGIDTLDAGIIELNDGITKFNKEGITKISNLVTNDIKPTVTKLESVIELGENYQSFGKKANNISGETRFILITESKNSPKKEVKEEIKEEKTTLWTRIKNLFK